MYIESCFCFGKFVVHNGLLKLLKHPLDEGNCEFTNLYCVFAFALQWILKEVIDY
jgi:hypothetical protein